MSHDENRPLIRDTTLMRWAAAGIGLLVTVSFSWAAKELDTISKTGARVQEDIELFQLQHQDLSNRVERISRRVDNLYEIVISQETGSGGKP